MIEREIADQVLQGEKGTDSFPTVYLSKPSIILPEKRMDNEEVLNCIHGNYRGSESEWRQIEEGVRYVFRECNSCYRYIEPNKEIRVADYAANAVKVLLELNGISPKEIDLLVYGGIAREYFEPATSMEIAAKSGIQKVHAFDVTSACVGLLEAIHIACAYFSLYQKINVAIVCSAELTREFISYDIQTLEELEYKAAGLTIGNSAAAWLLRREPLGMGCVKLLAMSNYCLPQHWHLCYVPIHGTFTSYSRQLFKLNSFVPPELKRMLDRLNWGINEVDHYIFHQPSDKMVRKVMMDLGAEPDKAVYAHSFYGNTSSTTVALTMHHLLKGQEIKANAKLILSSAAAGFSMVTAAGIWVI